MGKKKAIELSLKTVAIIILVLFVLIVSIIFFTTKFNEAKKQISLNKTNVVEKMFNDLTQESQ